MKLQLTAEEISAIQDHLNRVVALNQEIATLQGQFNRERRDLEIAWKVACYRHAAENGHEIDAIPPFISPQGKINVVLGEGGLATVADGDPSSEENLSGEE